MPFRFMLKWRSFFSFFSLRSDGKKRRRGKFEKQAEIYDRAILQQNDNNNSITFFSLLSDTEVVFR